MRNSVGSRRRFGNVKALCVPRRIRRSPPRDTLAQQLTHPTKEAASAALALLRKNIQAYEKLEAEVKATRELALEQAESARKEAQMAAEEESAAQQNAQVQEQQWHDALVREDFADDAAYQAACPASEAGLQARQAQLKAQEERLRALRQEQKSLQAELAEREDTPLEQLTQAYEAAATPAVGTGTASAQ